MRKSFYFIGMVGLALSLTACAQDNEDQAKGQNGSTDQTEQAADNKEQGENEPEGIIAGNSFFEPFDGMVDHIHGVGYAGNQNAVFFAAHNGLKVYENGNWYQTKTENNDYMGFNAVKDGFYTSGHPGMDSKLPDPLGIKKSTDYGKKLEKVALEGETDFHTMGVGYENNAIYAMNPQKNSLMDANKLYVSEDRGKKWKAASAKGLEQEILSIAVHPNNSAVAAVSGKNGIYLTEDKGENFELITENKQGTSVFFTVDSLWYGSYDGAAQLVKRSIKDGSEEAISLPKMDQDAVLYFGLNPLNESEMSFVTFNGDIYQTKDNAKTWNLLAKEGKLQLEK